MSGLVLILLFLGGILFFYLFFNNKFSLFAKQISEQLNQTLRLLLDTHKTVGDRLDSVSQSFSQVQKSLGQIQETNRYLCEVSRSIVSLQDLLRAPKFRGELGETLLENLLSEMLPKQLIDIPHRFQNGETVDACIVIGKN
ncbi:MAG: DNA recombination protein RmuC, partial [Candidatus Omnitrophica bacterium]|nr:DNA recombination protein RmuC [Candidatus Omnitrophota bacterium]